MARRRRPGGRRRLIVKRDAAWAELFRAPPSLVASIHTACRKRPSSKLSPDAIPAEKQDQAILYLHGGAYVMGGGELAAKAAQMFATLSGTRVFSLDYRMPPDHPYPAAIDDMVAAYREVLTRYAPGNVVVAGVSAGGGLAAAGILKLRDLGLPQPAGAILLTPEADLTESGDGFETNRGVDVVLREGLTASILLYAFGHDLRDPYLSPLFGDFSRGFPPTLLVSGTRDQFLSNTVRLHRFLRKAGIRADLRVFEAMPRGRFSGAPEDVESMAEQLRFVDEVLGQG